MPRDLHPAQCLNCQFASYTTGQIGYAEQHGTPLVQSSQMYCQIKREYTFKNDSCQNYTERHGDR